MYVATGHPESARVRAFPPPLDQQSYPPFSSIFNQLLTAYIHTYIYRCIQDFSLIHINYVRTNLELETDFSIWFLVMSQRLIAILLYWVN